MEQLEEEVRGPLRQCDTTKDLQCDCSANYGLRAGDSADD